MAKEPIPSWFVVVVVVRKGHRFLLVQERKYNETWYLPAGMVERGETFVEAAVRETMEEGGIPIAVEGLLRVEHTPYKTGSRLRVVVVARPVDDTPPHDQANEHVLQADWFTIDEMQTIALRGIDVLAVADHVLTGAPIYPLSLLTYEGAPYA